MKQTKYILHIDGARAIPLYERGSLRSLVQDFGIGLMTHFPQSDGITPVSKQMLNRMCRKETDMSFCKISEGMLSTPHAFTFLGIKWASSWYYGTYHVGDQRRLRWACVSAQSPEPSLFTHMKYGSRRRVWPKIRDLAPLDGCPCAFEEWVYGGRKVP